jgi:hypothetical protein
MTISSIAKPETRESTGLSLISGESSGVNGTTATRYRSSYRVDDARRLGEIVWESLPGRVSVAIESQMTIHPDSADWAAVLRYDVIGGALDAIHLKMPTAWAAHAALRLAGSEYQLTTEVRGPDAFWTITPQRPIWGSQRFVLRSTRDLESEGPIEHPDLTPLGRGAVNAYLRIINATGRTLATESVAGLQTMPSSAMFQASEFATGTGSTMNAYRVTRDSWVLRVQSPHSASRNGESHQASASLAFAEMAVVLMQDQSCLGRAVFDTIPGTGSALWFELPVDSSLVWATVDSNPAVPMRFSSGKWSIACDGRREARIGLYWRTNPAPPRSGHSIWPVTLPRLGAGSAPALISLYKPPGVVLMQEDHGGLAPVGPARFEVTRADWIARRARDFIPQIDRSSGRDHEKLMTFLVNHEIALRGALRAVQWSKRAAIRSEPGQTQRDLDLIRSSRTARDETIRRAGLYEDLTSALIYLGESSANVTGARRGVLEPSATDRIRCLGRASTFAGVVSGIDGASLRFSFSPESRLGALLVAGSSEWVSAALLLLAGVLLMIAALGRWTWSRSLALLMVLALAGWTGGPVIMASGLMIAAAGWRIARR